MIVWNLNYAKIESGETVTVTLSGTVNDKAVIGPAGNPNDVQLDVTNNTGENTIGDRVISYTYDLAVKKVDAKDTAKDLAGAEFSLKDSQNKVIGKYTYDGDGNVVLISGGEGKVTTGENGMVYFSGLDAGTYKIYEEKAPQGYKLLSQPVEVVITALKTDDFYNGEHTVSITNGNTAATVENNVQVDGETIKFVVQIKNYAGFTLPSTGGMGTPIFYVAGIVLFLAGVFFVARSLRKNV